MRASGPRIDAEWIGPVTAVTGLPSEVLVGLVLTVAHAAAFVPWESVRRALRSVLVGPPRERRLLWRGVEMTWPHGRIPLTVRIRRGRVRLRGHGRVTPTQLSRVVDALATVPHLHDLRLRGSAWRPAPERASRTMDSAQRFR